MKFKTLSEVEDYYWKIISEDDFIVSVSAVLNETGREVSVYGFDVQDDCDVIVGYFVKRWNSYYI